MITDKQLPAVAVAQRRDAIERLSDHGVFLPERAQALLSVYEGFQIKNIMAACLTMGLKFDLLEDERNIGAMVHVMDLVHTYHYVPRRNFFGIAFNEREVEAVDNDAPEGNRAAKPAAGDKTKTIAIILAATTFEENVSKHGLLQHISYVKQMKAIRNKEEMDQIMADILGEGVAVPSVYNRVCACRFVPVIQGIPYESMAQEWGYGIHLEEGMRPLWNGKPGKYIKKFGISQSSNKRTGSQIAESRALRNAARMVTNNLYPIENRSVVEILTAMYSTVDRLTAQAQDVLSLGHADSMQDAIDLVVEGKEEKFAGTDGGLTVEKEIDSHSPKVVGNQAITMSSGPSSEPTEEISDSPDIPYDIVAEDDGEWTAVDQALSNIARHIKKEPFWDLIVDLTRIQQSNYSRASEDQINFLCENLRNLMGWSKEKDDFQPGNFKLSGYLLMLLVQINTTTSLSSASSARLAQILVPSSKNKKWVNEDYDTEETSQARRHIQSIGDYVYEEIHGEKTGELSGK